MSDKIRVDFKIYMEPILAYGAKHMAGKVGCRTMSKYVRYAVIRALIQDGYPLDKVSKKFDKFYKSKACTGP